MKYSKKNKIYKITKRNYTYKPNLRKMSKHGGGIVGWVKHKYYMMKFNSFLNKFAKAKKELKSEYESFSAESDFYERDAKRKAELVSDFLTQTKVNTIVNLQDLTEEPYSARPVLRRSVQKDRKLSEKKIKEIRNRIRRLDKEHKSNKKEYNRMNKKFNKNIERFEKVTGNYTELAGFLEKVDSLYKKYSRLKGKDKSNLSKKHQNIIKRFENNNENFKKVHAFTESYMNKTNKFVDAYSNLRARAEFYNQQFNDNKILNFDQNIRDWRGQIENFYNALKDCNKEGKDFSKKFQNNIQRCINVFNRLRSVDDENGKVRKLMDYIRKIKILLEGCLKYQNKINDLVEVLKINFFKNEPAIRLQWDSNLIFAMAFRIEKLLKEIDGYLSKINKSN